MTEPNTLQVPSIPRRFLDPRPVLAVGTLAWLVGLVVCLVVAGTGREAALCAAGAGIGAVGYGMFLLQSRAARRGDSGAQEGMDAWTDAEG